MTNDDLSDAVPGASGTETLCLACGFCCNGTLHTNTVLLADEVASAQAAGLVVELVANRPAFRQPCPKFRDNRCSIYEQRPEVCRRYECSLLKRYLDGQITLERALKIMGVAREQLAVFRSRVPSAPSFMHWLKAIEAVADSPNADAQVQALLDDSQIANHATALVVYLTKHFGESHQADGDLATSAASGGPRITD